MPSWPQQPPAQLLLWRRGTAAAYSWLQPMAAALWLLALAPPCMAALVPAAAGQAGHVVVRWGRHWCQQYQAAADQCTAIRLCRQPSHILLESLRPQATQVQAGCSLHPHPAATLHPRGASASAMVPSCAAPLSALCRFDPACVVACTLSNVEYEELNCVQRSRTTDETGDQHLVPSLGACWPARLSVQPHCQQCHSWHNGTSGN